MEMFTHKVIVKTTTGKVFNEHFWTFREALNFSLKMFCCVAVVSTEVIDLVNG